jgi:uncharacterized protein (DUF736 family)
VTEYDNTNRGVLFVNREKKTEKSPDFSGSLDVAGIQYNLAAWKKQSKKGVTFLSVTVNKKPEIEQHPTQVAKPMREKDPDPTDFEFDSEVPF